MHLAVFGSLEGIDGSPQTAASIFSLISGGYLMWEYRLSWDSEPTWWKTAWQRGMEVTQDNSQSIEERPDLYLVLRDRTDVGLKLRGGDEFEVKILHQRVDGWELWEKIVIEDWNSLEALRFAGVLKVAAPAHPQSKCTPVEGAEAALSELGISFQRVEVHKKRIQTAARTFFDSGGGAICPDWLTELVEMRIQGRSAMVLSLCVETLEPLRGSAEPIPRGNASCCGYPELLLRCLHGIL